MYAETSQTLSAIKSRAVFQKRQMVSTPMGSFIEQVDKSSVKGVVNIEEAAISFYLSNHGFHLIEGRYSPREALPSEVSLLIEKHASLTSAMALRMFFYLITISAEEARFGAARNDRFFDFVESSTSKDACSWLRKLMDGKFRGTVLGEKKDVGSATLGECSKALELCFRFAQWSHGFGGLPWAQIAETAGEVVRGSNSLELMVDKAFTLCHNNGAIFNKGHFFSHYKHDFYSILDIQASGQMPSAIGSKINVAGFTSESVRRLYAQFAAVFPAEFSLPYDGSKVKSMEAVRAKKAVAAAAKATAFITSGGGAASVNVEAPPRRACDDLFSENDFKNVFGSAPL